MAALVNVNDCLFANRSAKLIGVLYSSFPLAEAAAAALCGPGTVTSSAGGDAAAFPQACSAARDGTLVLWLAGTTTFQQLSLQAFYFGSGVTNQGLFSCNSLYNTAALNVLDFLAAQGADAATRIVLVGHSYGGAVCMVIAARLLIANPSRKVELLTFGAPKAGDDRLIELTDPLTQIHYANENDPVPFFPPTGMLIAFLLPVVGIPLAFAWTQFARAKRVKVIAADGTVSDFDPNTQPETLLQTAALAIAAVTSPPAFRDHDVNWYGFYLCLGCTCVPRPCTPPPPPALNYKLGIRNFSYRFDGVAHFSSIGILPPSFDGALATVTNHFANGLPSEWRYTAPAGDSVLIQAAPMVGNTYTTFRIFYQPFPLDPLFLTYWDVTYGQIQLPLGHPAPTHFAKKQIVDVWNFEFELIATPVIYSGDPHVG